LIIARYQEIDRRRSGTKDSKKRGRTSHKVPRLESYEIVGNFCGLNELLYSKERLIPKFLTY